MDEKTAADLKKDFGYVPDEEREKWTIYRDSLIVASPNEPRLYQRGGGGVPYKLSPR